MRALAVAGSKPPRPCTWATRSTSDLEGAAAAGVRACSFAARAIRLAGVEAVGSLRSFEASSQPRAAASPGPAAASPPARPSAGGRRTALAGLVRGVSFLVALIATLVVGILAAALGVTSDDEDPVFTASATFLQSLIFIGTAVMFASFTRTPRAEHFGLRPTRFWPAVGWAALAISVF